MFDDLNKVRESIIKLLIDSEFTDQTRDEIPFDDYPDLEIPSVDFDIEIDDRYYNIEITDHTKEHLEWIEEERKHDCLWEDDDYKGSVQ